MNESLLMSLITAFFVSAASAYLGSVMVLKRMSLVGDALSHVALPGIGIALTYQINPFLGAFTALAIGILIIWQIEQRTAIPAEAAVGIIFAVALAIGILVTPEPELLEALFGDISKVSFADMLTAAVLSVAVCVVMAVIRKKMLLGLLSQDFAKAQGIKIDWLNFVFLALVAVIVALGVKVVGTLLMGALVIIPAAAAKNIAKSFGFYGFISTALGVLSGVGGVWLASYFNFPPGPIVVLVSAGIFLLCAIFHKK